MQSDMREWITRLGIQQYTKAFEEYHYFSLEKLKSLDNDQFKEMINKLNIKKGSAIKIENSLRDLKDNALPPVAYDPLWAGTGIWNVKNTPQPKGWKPENPQEDFTKRFSKDDGSCSVRETCENIKTGKVRNLQLPASFFIKSTRYQVYFRIEVTKYHPTQSNDH